MIRSLLSVVVALGATWVGVASAAPALPPGPVAGALDGAASADAPVALAALVTTLPSLPVLAPEAQADALGHLAARARSPQVAVRAALAAAEYEADPAVAWATARRLGFVTEWLVAGPDPTEAPMAALEGLRSAAPPRAGAAVELAGQPRRWQRLLDHGPVGGVAFGELALPDRGAVVHLVSVVESDRARPAVLRAGASGALAVAHGGRGLGSARGLGVAQPGQLEAPIRLRRGRNLITVAVAPDPGVRPVLYLRIGDAAGRPLAGVSSVALGPEEASPWGPLASVHAELGANRDLVALERRGRRAFKPRLAAAELRRALGLPDSADGAGYLLEDLLLTPEAGALPAERILRALAWVPREESRASVLLHLAATGRDDPLLRLALAELAAERGQLVRARAMVDAVGAQGAAGLERQLQLVRARVDRLDGIPETGWRELLPTARDAAARPSERWLAEAASAALELDRPDVAAPIQRRLAAAAPGRLDYAAALAQSLVAQGDVARAIAGYEALALRRPDLVGYRLEAARLAGLAGQTERARGVLAEVARRVRWDPDRLEMIGRLYEDLGAPGLAATHYERVLELRPASDGVRQSLERLSAAGAQPPPLTMTLDAEMQARGALDPDAAFESLGEEIVVRLADDGSATRWVRRLLRVQRVPDDRAARTITVPFDPSQEALDEMARVARPGALLLVIETLGTGHERPSPPDSLRPYFALLEADGFVREAIRTDYRFASVAEASALLGRFFGVARAAEMVAAYRADVPECTGLWWRRA